MLSLTFDSYGLLGRPILRNDEAFAIDSGTLQGAGGVGGLVAVSIGGQYYFPCYDNLGNVVAYVDESGTEVASCTYDAKEIHPSITRHRHLLTSHCRTYTYRRRCSVFVPFITCHRFG